MRIIASHLFPKKCFDVLDNDNKLVLYSENYDPSLKLMHTVITKFAQEIDDALEQKVDTLNKKAIFEARLARKKEQMAETGIDLGEDMDIEHLICGSDGDEDDTLSDSDYDLRRGTKTLLKHKNHSYRTGKTKDDVNLKIPGGKYRCIKQQYQCTGTVEPMLKRNGHIHIRPVDDHSCEPPK